MTTEEFELHVRYVGDHWRREWSRMWTQYWIAVGVSLFGGWALGAATAFEFCRQMGWLWML